MELPEGLNPVLYNMPYGLGLWKNIQRWPNEAYYKVNTITRIASFDCDGDFYLLVETLLPAAGQLALVLLDFGWDDVARGFFRPAGIRSRFKFRWGSRFKGKFLHKLPELGEEVGKRIPGARIFKGLNAKGGWRWFWRIDALAQRALFYWMLADIVVDFGYTWTTGIIRHERCWQSGRGWMIGGPGLIAWPADGKWSSVGPPPPVRTGGVDAPESVPLVVVPGRKYSAAIALGACRGFLGYANGIASRIVNVDTGEVVDESPVWDPTRDEPTASLAFLETDKPGRYMPQVVAYATPGDTAICAEATYFAKWEYV